MNIVFVLDFITDDAREVNAMLYQFAQQLQKQGYASFVELTKYDNSVFDKDMNAVRPLESEAQS